MRRGDDERGAAAVEFALVAPLLVLLMFGIIELGTLYNTDIRLTNGAMAAARTVATGGTVADARAAAITQTDRPAAAIVFTPATCSPGTNLTVTVRSREGSVTRLFGNGVTLQGKGTVRCS